MPWVEDTPKAPSQGGGWVEDTPQGLANATIAPKGGTPFRATAAMDDYLNIVQQLNQQRVLPGNEDRSALGNIAQSAATQYSNNMLATPSVAADLLSYPVRRIAGAVQGKETPWFGATPRLTVADIAAAARGATDPNMTVAQARENIDVAEAQRKGMYPVGTGTGEVVGDIATLAAGRLPFTNAGRARAYDVLARKKIFQAEKTAPLTVGTFRGPTNLKGAVSRSATNVKFERGIRRVLEAGAEGGALALLHEGQDPLEAAGFTAGAQGVLSGVTEATTRKWINIPGAGPVGKVTGLALQLGGLSMALYALGGPLPGEYKDWEAQQAASSKLLWGGVLGAATGLFSARARGGVGSAYAPRLAEAFGSAPRNAMQSIIVDHLRESDEAGRTATIAKLNFILNNPDKVAPKKLRDLSAAMNSGSKARFLKELDEVTAGQTP